MTWETNIANISPFPLFSFSSFSLFSFSSSGKKSKSILFTSLGSKKRWQPRKWPIYRKRDTNRALVWAPWPEAKARAIQASPNLVFRAPEPLIFPRSDCFAVWTNKEWETFFKCCSAHSSSISSPHFHSSLFPFNGQVMIYFPKSVNPLLVILMFVCVLELLLFFIFQHWLIFLVVWLFDF